MSDISGFYKKHSYKIFLFLSVLLGFTPLLWFHGKILAGEEFYAVNYARWGDMFSHTWFDRVNFGQPNQLLPFKFQGLFFYFLSHIGVSTYFSLLIWHLSLWVLGSVGCYLLLNALFQRKVSPAIVFVSVIFYTYSPFFLNISPLLSPPRIVFTVLPYILLVLYKYHCLEKNFSLFIDLNLILLLASPAFVNLPAGIVLFIPIYLYLFFAFVFKFKPRLSILWQTVAFTFLYLILNSWWLYPTYQILTVQTSSIRTSSAVFKATSLSPLYEVLSQFGSWAFRDKVGKYYYFSYNESYYKFPLVIFKYIPIFLILTYLYSKFHPIKIKDKIIKDSFNGNFLIFIIFFFLFSTFLSKGTSGALGIWYQLLFEHLPFFWVFREPYLKFLPLVCISSVILITGGINYLVTKFKNSFWIPVTLLICFISLGYPFFLSQVIWNVNDGSLRSYYVDVPKEVTAVEKNLKPSDGNYLVFPTTNFVDKYSWPSGYSGNTYLMYTTANLLNPKSSYAPSDNVSNQLNYLYNSLFTNSNAFIKQAESFNMAGLISQKSVIDPLVNANSELRKLYGDSLSYQDGYTDFYTFNKTSNLFNLQSKNTLLKLSSQQISLYNLVKDTYGSSKMVHYIDPFDNTADIEEIRPVLKNFTNNNSVLDEVYDLNKFNSDSYYLRINTKSLANIQSVTNENGALLSTSKDLYSQGIRLGSNICCKSLRIVSNPNTDLYMPPPEIIYGNVKLNGEFEQALDQNSTDAVTAVRYVFKMNDLDINQNYKTVILGSTPEKVTTIFMVNELEPFLNINKSILSGYLAAFGDGFTLNFRTDVAYNFSKNTYYELVVQVDFQNNENFKTLLPQTNIDSLHLTKIVEPSVFVAKVPFSEYEGTDINASPVKYKKINSSVYIVDLTNASSSILKFTQAYDKKWGVIPITKLDYESLSKENVFIRLPTYLKIVLKNPIDIEPLNLENASNGWDTDSLSKQASTNYFAVVYKPEGFYSLTFILSMLLVASYLALQVFQRLKK